MSASATASPPSSSVGLKSEQKLPNYFTFNPAVFDDKIWTTKDLRKLSRKLGVSDEGSRSSIIHRLRQWHRTDMRNPYKNASNFSMLGVQVYSPPSAGNENLPLRERTPKVDARLLSPLVKRKGSARKILKTKSQRDDYLSSGSSDDEMQEGMPRTPGSARGKKKKKKKAIFSPYNRVKIIPSRHEQKISPFSERFQRYRQDDDGADMDYSGMEDEP